MAFDRLRDLIHLFTDPFHSGRISNEKYWLVNHRPVDPSATNTGQYTREEISEAFILAQSMLDDNLGLDQSSPE